jgi:4-amino-4-deoxy-L-arabinose transferase-like glycosyltransferase
MKPRKTRYVLFAILGAALLLRILHWLAVRNEPFFAQLAMDSQEYDRWAREIAAGNWAGSGVFFQAPLYPYLLAVLYKVFGHILDGVYLFQIVAAVAGIYALYRAGRTLAGEKAGLWAAGLAAVYGGFFFYDVQIQKESLAVAIVCFLIWILAEARLNRKIGLWLLSGVLCGFLSLLRENTLLIVPFLLIMTYRSKSRAGTFLKSAGAFILGIFLVLAPVALRNGIVGGSYLPTTFQGGVNFYIGNNAHAAGTYQSIVPGKEIPYYERTEPIRLAEQETGRKLTPAQVSNFWLKKSLSWIWHKPWDYIKLQAKKFVMFWSWYEWPDTVDYYYVQQKSWVLKYLTFGFGSLTILAALGLVLLGKRIQLFSPVIVFLVGWLVSTVAFFLFSRYRLPAVPCLLLFAAQPFVLFFDAIKRRKTPAAALVAAGIVIAFAAPLAARFEPRMDLVHYNLAVIYDQKGETQEAAVHYREALSLNPKDFLSCLNLGIIEARQNRWQEALQWYEKAASLEPSFEGAPINMANIYIVLGKIPEAEAALDRALAINSKSIEALHSKSILAAKKGDLNEALSLNQKVLELAPEWEPALRTRARLEGLLKK